MLSTPSVKMRYRRTVTGVPALELLPVLERSSRYEPCSMVGQPLVVWGRTEAFQVARGGEA